MQEPTHNNRSQKNSRLAITFLGIVTCIFLVASTPSIVTPLSDAMQSVVSSSTTAAIMRALDSIRHGRRADSYTRSSHTAAQPSAPAPTPVTPVTFNTVVVLATSTTPAVTATPTPSTTVQATTVPTIAATTPVPAIIATPPLNYNFGMSVATTLLGLNDAQLNAELDDLVSLHIGWVRMDFDWSLIQPDTNVAYNWDNYDRVVHALNARNIKVLGILDYSTHWAISPTCGFITCPPQNNADFADFAADIAKHYGPQGLHTWEIWNEPNNRGFWKPGANVAGYVQLLEAAYPAIKAADPQAFVISGGLAPEATSNGNIAPVDFLSLMYALGAKNYFDAVGFHPYSFPAQPSYFAQWNAWQQMSATSPSVRSVMIANGDADKQVWLTEYGAPTDGPGVLAPSDNFFANGPDHVNEPVQTDIIAEGITLKEASPWTGPLFLYSYKDLGTSNSTVENFFGILRYDGSRKSSYLRLQQLIQ